jgi:hypothetical protein
VRVQLAYQVQELLADQRVANKRVVCPSSSSVKVSTSTSSGCGWWLLLQLQYSASDEAGGCSMTCFFFPFFL